MNQEKVIDVRAFPVLFISLIFLRNLIPSDSFMCTYVNFSLYGRTRVGLTIKSVIKSLSESETRLVGMVQEAIALAPEETLSLPYKVERTYLQNNDQENISYGDYMHYQ